MAEEFLDGADVIVGFEEMGGKAVAEGVGGDPFGNAGRPGCGPHGFLQAAFPSAPLRTGVDVVAMDQALTPSPSPRGRGERARIHRKPGSRKDVLPDPLFVGVGVFARQGIGQIDCAVALGQVFFVGPFDDA